MHPSLALFIASFSLTSAAPAVVSGNERIVRQIDDNIIDPWGEYGRKPDETINVRDVEVLSLLSRQNPNGENNVGEYIGNIPNCKDVDPSIEPLNTAYTVDQGVKIPRTGDNDECTTGSNKDHCWYDMILLVC
jgi:hypothetical protein